MKHILPLPYFFLLFFIITNTFYVNISIAIHGQCVETQQLSLLHLKKTLTFDPESSKYPASSKFILWNSSTDCCSWAGVTCNTNGSVVGLDMSSQYISGGIDNLSSLFHLQHLQSLNLANNSFVDGTRIPSSIGKLTNLRYLNLSSNSGYSGKIPIEISHLTKLVVLDISEYGWTNKLESPNLSMLFQNLTKIRELYLEGINISAQGTQWCQAISSSLPDLRVLSLSGSQISGPFCQSLAKLQSLSVIQLDSTDISGPIPGFFAKFSNLTSLNLRSCILNGTFPNEIFQVPTLQAMDLSDNIQLHGSLPEFPENVSRLQVLYLGSTKFSGLLPDSIGNLKMLSTLYLESCSFSGSIPKSMASLTELVGLYMSSNMFNGSIDSIYWGNLVNLQYFKLESNLLTGSIPSSIFSPPLLKELILSHNQFSGQLHEFSNVSSSLSELDLSFNNLEGPIPVSIFNIRGLKVLSLSSNNFSSFPFNGHPHQQASNLTKNMRSLNQFEYLDLAFNNLRTVPDFLKNQTKFETLDLSGNQIQKVPNWIWSLHSLLNIFLSSNSLVTLEGPFNYTREFNYLDLHSNQLKGSIPLLFAYYLDYSSNHFTSIPTNIGDFLYLSTKSLSFWLQYPSTTFLSISSNDLHGLIPASICNASHLQLLDLSINSVSGTIPQCLSTMSYLQVLNLRRNNLTGSISDFKFPANSDLEFLKLNQNQIDGQFPKSLANCSKLQVVNLENNQIQDTFPCLLRNISTLRVLALRSNKFYGRIGCPEETNGTWPMLQIIDVAHNNFHGEILGKYLETKQAMINSNDDATPIIVTSGSTGYQETITVVSKGYEVELVKILTIFTTIDFSCNNFSGQIPKEMGELNSLYLLNLSSNAFTGEIPSSFGNMQQLESLDLSQNKLSGKIPPQLAKLTFLSFLNLSNNQLVGRIPTGPQFSTFTSASFKGNKGLWGAPLTVDSKAGLSPPPTSIGRVSSSGHEIDWDLINVEIGFVCGFGVAVGSLVLCKRWRKWYYKTMYKNLVKIFPQLEDRIGRRRSHVHINQRFGR